MGIYEQFMRFVKMLNYDTNVEIKFIIISHAMRGFCEIWGHLNHLQRVSFHRRWVVARTIYNNSEGRTLFQMTLRSQEILFQRQYISNISGRHAPYLLVGAVTVVPPQYII